MILSVGIEAAWRLGNWRQVKEFVKINSSRTFGPLLGEALLHLQEGQLKKVDDISKEILKNAAESIVSSSFDSYESSYSSSLYLHIVQDLSTILAIYRKSNHSSDLKKAFTILDQRFSLTRPLIKHREFLLQFRQAILGILWYLFYCHIH